MRKNTFMLIGMVALGVFFFLACKPLRKKVAVPAPPPVESTYAGPATELENQATSTPVPSPVLSPKPVTEPPPQAQPIPLPASPPVVTPPPVQKKAPAKKRVRIPPPSEPVSAPPPLPAASPATPVPLQLEPLMSQKDRDDLKRKIDQELKSARKLLEKIKGRNWSDELSSYPATIADFISKAEAAQKRGDFRQSLAMAEKANTLASSLAKQ